MPRMFRGFLVTVCLVSVGLAGCIQAEPSGDEAQTRVPTSIFITDAPVDVSRLDVGISYVTVGGVPLEVVASSFDLASLQGPDDAILLAQGSAPGGDQAVEIAFSWARATVGNETIPVDVGGLLRVDGISPEAGLLVDVDLADSLTQSANGLQFLPSVKDLYVLDAAAAAGAPAWVPAATSQTAANAQSLPVEDAVEDAVDQAPSPEVSLPEPPVAATVVGEAVGWLVQFQQGTDKDNMRKMSEDSGLVYVWNLQSLPAAYVLGTELQIQNLLGKRGVERAERETPLSFHDAESRLALQMPELANPVTGLRDAQGNPIDGRGVGVAVVDTGIYATHADLLYKPLWSAGRVAMNLKVESLTYTDLPSTDSTAGHGTHVAGIISGQGTSNPDNRGVAPGSKLYGLGVGEAKTIVWAAEAFDWILQNHDQVDPPIRVVTNSWGSDTPYDPNSALTRLVNQMVGEGIVVVFSAGNDGGDGMYAETSAQCQIPTPGVVCVAAYDDQGTGTRDGAIASYSSRGWMDDPATWPDISAPGSNILSTRPPAGSTTGVGYDLGYVELSGTSQATPHVAGVAALMLQENPSLTPAQVESHLKATAYKFADGGAYYQGSHHAKGAGLLDAYAAVAAVS